MLPNELQDRLGFKEVSNTNTAADTDNNNPAVNEVVDPDPLVVILDGVNLIDDADDDGSDRDVVMEPVYLDLDTDDDHEVYKFYFWANESGRMSWPQNGTSPP
eukprot:11202109-Ditylum_brightwellii.AAC.1